MDFQVNGVSEFEQDLKKAVDAYPDYAIKTLNTIGRELKKETLKNTDERVKERSGNLKKGIKVSTVKITKNDMSKELYTSSNHFHLIEDGHEKVTRDGRNIGFTQGKHMLRDAAETCDKKFPEHIEEMVDHIFKECNL